jgi:pimeloyl-ACP methyl ester carboxylesterase
VKTRWWLLSFAVLIAAAAVLGGLRLQRVLMPSATAAALAPEQADRAQRFLDHLDAGRYDDALAMTTPTVRDALANGKLQAVWEGLPAQLGPRKSRGAPRGEAVDGHPIVTVALEFGMLTLDARIGFDAQNLVEGFRIVPASATSPPESSLVSNARYSERELQVGEGDRGLAATLTLPRGEGPFAAAVLVHGSGPQDRDSTLGPNRPFRDLAHGLAERGIAVLRFDKRTKARPQDFASGDFTIDAETTDDAVAALAQLGREPGIDPARRYVIGHSQGAMMAPRIAQRAPDVAGLVLLAAPARPLAEIYLQQIEYLAALSDGIDASERMAIDAERAKATAVETLTVDSPAESNLMQLPARYWIDLRGYDPVATAGLIAQPMLIAQGERDYQVTLIGDYARWHDAFATSSRVELHSYPDLNHLLMHGEGAPSPQAFARAGQVDARVIDDIANWIGGGHARD